MNMLINFFSQYVNAIMFETIRRSSNQCIFIILVHQLTANGKVCSFSLAKYKLKVNM